MAANMAVKTLTGLYLSTQVSYKLEVDFNVFIGTDLTKRSYNSLSKLLCNNGGYSYRRQNIKRYSSFVLHLGL